MGYSRQLRKFGLGELENLLTDVTKCVHVTYNIRIRIDFNKKIIRARIFLFVIYVARLFAMRQIDFYLRAILKETGWTQTDLATRLETTQATVSRWLKGSEPEGHRRDAIVELYRSVATPEDGNFSEGENTVRLIGYIGAGQAIYPLDDGADEKVEAPKDAKPSTVAAKIRGDSMLPVFHENWLIYWSRHLPPEEMQNQLCVVQLADGRLLVKTLRRGSDDGLWTLTSFNASDIIDVPVEWAAPIDWIKPR